MGYYIETKTSFNKAEIICRDYNGTKISKPLSFTEVPADKGLIVIVDNGMFEAAGFCYNEREFAEFSDPLDTRPKSWVLIDRARAEELSGYKRK
jgi:hypothetical protein